MTNLLVIKMNRLLLNFKQDELVLLVLLNGIKTVLSYWPYIILK